MPEIAASQPEQAPPAGVAAGTGLQQPAAPIAPSDPERAAAAAELARLGGEPGALVKLQRSATEAHNRARAVAGGAWRILDGELRQMRADCAAAMQSGFDGRRHRIADPVLGAMILMRARRQWESYASDPRGLQTRARVTELSANVPTAAAAPRVDTALRLVASLASRGIVLALGSGDKIIVKMPQLLNDTDRRLLRENRAAICQLLNASEVI